MFEFNLSQNMCCACLKMVAHVQLVPPEEMDLYKTYVNKLSGDEKTEIYVCNICAHLLKKFNKFMKQCQKAYSMLSNILSLDNKEEVYETDLKLVYNFTKSDVILLDFPGFDDDDDGRLEALEVNVFDDEYDDVKVDEEDLPLVMLKTEDVHKSRTAKKRKRRCVKKKNNGEIKTIKTLEKEENNFKILESGNKIVNSESYQNGEVNKEMVEIEIKLETDKMKRKKVLKDGFTSRMVQETDEYTVIKLSKEQVLKEMEEKAKSDEYLRSLYKCEKCVKGFNFEDVLRKHMERHIMKKGWLGCDLCQQYCPTIVSLRGHMKSHTTRYKCKLCSCVRLSRQVLLDHHATFHTGARKYTCQLCDFVSNKRTIMQRHVRTRHNKAEKHPCDQCGKTLNSLETLRVHTARHDKSKRVKCDECDRHFVYPSLLHQHKMAVHVRDDYYCVECDIKFKSRENLSLHFKRNKRHRDISAFRYECDHCAKRFMYVSALTSHLSSAHGTGQRYSCACGRHYSSRDALRAHAATHAQLVCEQCTASFTRKSLLRAHMRTHTSERPFACECGATFAKQDTLAAHALAKHHKKEEVPLPLQN